MSVANQTVVNASSSYASSFNSTGGLLPLLLLLAYIIVALLAAQFVAPWLARSQILSSTFGKFLDSVAYALKGFAASAVLAVLALPVWFVATFDSQAKGIAMEVVAVGVGGYIALVVVGMLADRATTAFIDAHPEYDEWDDIFPDDEVKGETSDD